MTHKVTLIPGDGIGPEVTQATVRILEATGVKFEWESFSAGAEAFEKYKEYIPKELSDSLERTHVGLKGPVTTPIGGGFSSINVELRKRFELFANFRPIRNLPHIPTRYPGVDLIIVRENTEGLYSGIEHEVVPGVVESLKIMTEKACTRVSRFAFEYARKNKRKKIHSIHKANIMKMSDGLFLRCSRAVAKEYPEITYGEHIVDNTCMQLVMNPYQYDMLLMENLYGDILSDLCAGLVADLRSALLMLRHLGEHDAALKIRNAIDEVYRDSSKLTRDVGGTAGTSEFADAIIQAMETQSVAAAAKQPQ
jgi:isocitrate dehydrogenase (NAD+)